MLMGRLPVHNKSSRQCEDFHNMYWNLPMNEKTWKTCVNSPMMCDDSENARVLPHCRSKCSHNVKALPDGGVACMAIQLSKF